MNKVNHYDSITDNQIHVFTHCSGSGSQVQGERGREHSVNKQDSIRDNKIHVSAHGSGSGSLV